MAIVIQGKRADDSYGKVSLDDDDNLFVRTRPQLRETNNFVAGASSVLGKIGAVAASGQLIAALDCSAFPVERVDWAVAFDNSWNYQLARANSNVLSVTITLASVQANDTVIINGLTFTAHADTTVEATGQFKIDGATDTLDADELVKCINTRFAALGITADAPAAVVTLTATTATAIQCATGTGGARIICADTTQVALDKQGSQVTGKTTTAAWHAETVPDGGHYIDGWGWAYLIITNAEASTAVAEVRGTRY